MATALEGNVALLAGLMRRRRAAEGGGVSKLLSAGRKAGGEDSEGHSRALP